MNTATLLEQFDLSLANPDFGDKLVKWYGESLEDARELMRRCDDWTSKGLIGEPNDAYTRVILVTTLSATFRGFFDTHPDVPRIDYQIVCDERNNSLDIIEQERLDYRICLKYSFGTHSVVSMLSRTISCAPICRYQVVCDKTNNPPAE